MDLWLVLRKKIIKSSNFPIGILELVVWKEYNLYVPINVRNMKT